MKNNISLENFLKGNYKSVNEVEGLIEVKREDIQELNTYYKYVGDFGKKEIDFHTITIDKINKHLHHNSAYPLKITRFVMYGDDNYTIHLANYDYNIKRYKKSKFIVVD